MSAEITVNASVDYSDASGREENLAVADKSINVTTKTPVHTTQIIPTSNVALNNGGISGVGILMLKNLDDTNFVTIVDSWGHNVAILKAGETFGPVRAADSLQAPSVNADTASVTIEAFLCPP